MKAVQNNKCDIRKTPGLVSFEKLKFIEHYSLLFQINVLKSMFDVKGCVSQQNIFAFI